MTIPPGAIVVPDSDVELPEFDNPPVREVALGFQFQPLVQLRTLKLGLLWQRYKTRGFPLAEEQPPLPDLVPEPPPSAAPSPGGATVRIEWSEAPPTPRCWFLDESRTKLIQVQRNRFVQNWRHVQPGEKYPRYALLRTSFIDELSVFQDFVSDEALGEIVPDQCEVTYVNHFVRGAGWNRFGEVGELVGSAKPDYSDDFLKEPEDVRIAHKYSIYREDGTFLGRLHLTLESAFQIPDFEPIIVLTLSARGRPMGDGSSGVVSFCDVGHRSIVKAFASLTTGRGHSLWKRRK